MPTPVRIHIGVNFFGAGNIGDDLMLAGFLRGLGKSARRVRLSCCTPFDIQSQRRRFPTIDWSPDTEEHRTRALANADIWLALGDTPFQLDSGSWMRDHLSAQQRLARSFNLPMFYLGVGVERASALDDATFRELAATASHIWCRDAASAQLLRPWSGAVTVGADLSHAYLGVYQGRQLKILNRFKLGVLIALEDSDQVEKIKESLRKVFRDPRAFPDKPIVWLHQEVRDFQGSERQLFNELSPAERSRFVTAIPNYRARSVAGLLRGWPRCRTVASSRYHALCVMAWRGVRLIAIHRSGKLAGLAADLGIPLVGASRLAEALHDVKRVDRNRLKSLAGSACAMIEDFGRVVGIGTESRNTTGLLAASTGAPSHGVMDARKRTLAAQHIAIVKYDSIGDFILLSPFLRETRKIWPQAHITLYVRPVVEELARLCPYVDRVVTSRPVAPGPSTVNADLPADGYDLVLVPRAATDHFGGLPVAAAIGGRERWGFADTSVSKLDFSSLTHALAMPDGGHHVEMNLSLLRPFNSDLKNHLELWPSAECVERWRNQLSQYRLRSEKPLCLLGIGAQHGYKTWSPENFASIIPYIVEKLNLVPVLVGNRDEAESASIIFSQCRSEAILNFTTFSLEDVCAIAGFARLYVGNDTSVKHISAAARVPIVEVNPYPIEVTGFEENMPRLFYPRGVRYEMLRPPPGLRTDAVESGKAIAAISPDEVIAAIERLMPA